MIKIKRIEGKKVDFSNEELRKPMLDKKEKEIGQKEEYIKKKFMQLKEAEKIISSIQNEIKLKSGDILKKELEIQKMANLWNDMNKINLNDLNEDEIGKIVNSQKGFISDLLTHYINSTKKEKNYLAKIEELTIENNRLLIEIDSVLEELENMNN